MKCINCHSPPFFPLLSQPEYHPQLNSAKLQRLPTKQPSRSSILNKQQITRTSLRTKAIHTSFVLGVTSSAKPPDISVLIQTSAVLLFVYWIANFVVPEMLSKDPQKRKDQNPDDENPSERS